MDNMLIRRSGALRGHAVFFTAATVLGLAFAGCSAPEPDGGGGPDGTDAPDGGGDLSIDGVGDGDDGPIGEYCDEVKLDFTPKTPTVYVLVDRSGSIFDKNQWGPLRTAVLPVIQELQADVRFAFGAFHGSSATGACSLDIAGVDAPALNNYDAIATAYNGLERPTGKLDTPSSQAIREVTERLKADTDAPGGKFILFVTADDDQDFCNDGDVLCPADAMVATMQLAAAEGIRTFVFGLSSAANMTHPEWLDMWAQAGQGEEPNWADGLEVGEYNGKLDSQCKSNALWSELKTANGNAGFEPAGNYTAAGGTTTAITSDNPAEVANQIKTRVQTLKSCVFDLTNAGISVKEGAQGDVFVNEEMIPDEEWKMNSPTVLEITGEACLTWLKPEVTAFEAGFACEFLNGVK